MSDHRKETDYYEEIAKGMKRLLVSNLNDPDIEVYPLVGEIRSALTTLLANEGTNNETIRTFVQETDTLNLDVSFFVFNKSNGKYEVIILEVKKRPSVGLTELSQLVGYCLVSKAKFGLLVNVDALMSERLANTAERDPELTFIERKYKGNLITHRFGIMKWDSVTQSFEYSNIGSIKSVPDLVESLKASLA